MISLFFQVLFESCAVKFSISVCQLYMFYNVFQLEYLTTTMSDHISAVCKFSFLFVIMKRMWSYLDHSIAVISGVAAERMFIGRAKYINATVRPHAVNRSSESYIFRLDDFPYCTA
jgi:hypothetical protein